MPRKPSMILPDGIPDQPIRAVPKLHGTKRPTRDRRPTPETSAKRANTFEAKYNLTVEKVCEVIVKERGILNEIARTLGVSRAVIRGYIGERAFCAQTLKEAREAMGDTAERKLYELIEAGDVKCIMYYLSTVHKARGYGMKRKDEDFLESKTQISTINIIAVPNGQYLPPEEPLQVEYQSVTTEDEPDLPFEDAAPEPVTPVADCLT